MSGTIGKGLEPFASNQKISGRQAGRFFTLCTFGTAGLTIPRFLAGLNGGMGIYSVFLGGVLLVIYLFLTGKIYEKVQKIADGDLRQKAPVLWAIEKVVKVGILSVLVVGAAFFLVQQSTLVQDMLLPQIPVWALSGVFLLLCGYGAKNGVEDLSRIGEVLFGLIVFLLVILFLITGNSVSFGITAKEVFLQGQEINLLNVLKGVEKMLIFFLPILLIPFHFGDFSDQKKGRWGVFRALVVSTVFLGLVFFFSIGIFGPELTKRLPWSLVELMTQVRLPGGLFGKVDAFFSMIFILGLFFIISQMLTLWTHSVRSITKRELNSRNVICKWILPVGMVLVYVISLFMKGYYEAENFYVQFMKWFGLWLFLGWMLIQALWLLFRGKRGVLRVVGIFLTLPLLGMSLTGCEAPPENREYVLAMGMDAGEKGYSVIYSFPDLSKVSDQGGSMENRTSYVAEVKYLADAEEKYLSETYKEPDYNHLKALVIEQSLTEQEHFKKELEKLCMKETYGRDTLIILCEGKASDLLEAATAEGGSAGIFLEELCENTPALKDKEVLTVGDFCFFVTENSERGMVRGSAENLVVPLLAVEEDRPTISRIMEYNSL